jgi:sec-independent protein translocase protein TatB
MFDISWSEFAIIAVVALIAIGPKELPGVLRTVGQWIGKARKMASEFQGQFQEAMREAEMADLKKSFDEVKEAATGFASGNVMTSLQKDVASALNIDDIDKPVATSEAVSLAEASTAAPAGTTAAKAEVSEPLATTPATPPHLAAPETGSATVEVETPRDAEAS